MIASLLDKIRAARPYPLSIVWAGGVTVAVGITRDWFDLGVGLVLLSSLTIGVFMVLLRQEVRVVRGLVNGQRTELLARIDTLVEMLVDRGIDLPEAERKEGP